MTYKEIINQVSKELNLPKELVDRTYKSYWLVIRQTIQDLPLKGDITMENFTKLATSFNIPSLGKLATTYDKVVKMKERFNYIKNLKNAEDKEVEANVYSFDNNG